MVAYSLDLREWVMVACDAGGASRAAVTARFAVSLGLVQKLLAQRRRAGHVRALPCGLILSLASAVQWWRNVKGWHHSIGFEIDAAYVAVARQRIDAGAKNS